MNKALVILLLLVSSISGENKVKKTDDSWNTMYDSWVYVSESKVNMYEEATITSKTIGVLNVTDRVQIIKKNNAVDKINGVTGSWVLVRNICNNRQGWVFDYYLANKNSFSPCDNLNIKEISFMMGEL